MDQDTTAFSPAESWRRPSPRLRRLQGILGKDFAAAYVLMLPTLIIMGGLIAYPFVRALYISFTRTHGRTIGPFIGLDNYRALWADRFFRESVVVTIQYTAWSVGLTFLLSTLAATLVHRLGPRANILAGLMFLPWIMPEIVRAITWRGLLNPLYGALNRVLIDLGIIQRGFPFFGSMQTALPSVIAVSVWQRVPFFLLNLLAGLKSIDVELYDAASIDGASGWRQFLHITLPGLRNVIIVVLLLATIWSFNEFSLIFLLTGGGPMNATKVYSVLAYWLARQRMGMGVAVAMSMAPVFVLAIMALGRYIVRQEDSGTREATSASGLVATLSRVLSVPLLALGCAVKALFWGATAGLEGLAGLVTHLGPAELSRAALRRRRRAGTLLAWAILLALAAFELAPFYSVIVTAGKSELQITLFESVLWPRPWSTQQFQRLLGPGRNFWPWLQNTLLVSLVTPALTTLVAAGGAYALVRLKWRGAYLLGRLVLVSYLMPAVMIVMLIYHLFGRLGLLNTRLSLILSYVHSSLRSLATDGLLCLDSGRAG